MNTTTYGVEIFNDTTENDAIRILDLTGEEIDAICGIFSEDLNEWNNLAEDYLGYWGWTITARNNDGTPTAVTAK